MDGIDRHDGGTPGEGAATPGRPWDGDEERMTQFSGVVGEVQDPLTWGLDLEDESLTGLGDDDDPTCERFVRAYRCFTGEALEVETLRTAATADDVEDVVRAACSGALAAPLHADIAAPVEPDAPRHPPVADVAAPDFTDSYQDYRSAMRALVAEVDRAPLRTSSFDVDGEPGESVEVTARGIRAVYVVAADRALVVTGPAGLVEQVDVVTRPVQELMTDHGRQGGSDGGAPGPPGPPVPPVPGGS